MSSKWLAKVVMASALLGLTVSAMAHHSPSAYDNVHIVSKVGTLTEFRLQNPHAIWKVEVKGDDGQPVTWVIEGNPPNWFRSAGVTKFDFDKGIKNTVTIFFNAALDGSPRGYFKKIQFADGTFVQFGNTVY